MLATDRAALSIDPFLTGLPGDAREALMAALRVQNFAPGEAVFRQGDAPNAFCCVLAGELEVSTVTPSGAKHIAVHLYPVRWVGELSFLDELPRTHDVSARSASRLALIPSRAIRRLMRDHDAIYKGMVANLCANTRLIYRYFDDFQKRSAETLMALSVMEILSQRGGGVEIELSQQALADRIGASRQTVNAVLSKWQDRGLIRRSYRCVTVLDKEALADIASA